MATGSESKRLYRNKQDAMVFGVAAGLADYFDFDPALVRVAWVVAILASGGTALLAYVILAIVMPKKGSDTSDSSQVVRENLSDLPEEAAEATSNAGEALGIARSDGDSDRRLGHRTLLALVLIAVGTIILLKNLGFLYWWRWDILWPVVLIAIGATLLVGRVRSRDDG